MTYFEQQPTKQLSQFIDKFWYCQANNLTGTYLTIPFLHHELVFNFSHHYHINGSDRLNSSIQNPVSWINGIQTRAFTLSCSGYHEMMGVLFRPNGLKAFTKYHAREFENSFVDATLIFDKHFSTLLDQIQNTAIASDKITLIENYLIKNLIEQNSPEYLNTSIHLFSLATPKRHSVNDICNQISVTNKSLIKSFSKYIGISPVKYLHLQTINNALILLTKNPNQSLTTLAYKLNFYDQAHFTNFFKSITTLTPSQYSDLLRNNMVDKTSPNFIFLQG